MSHVVTVKLEVKDTDAIKAAAERTGAEVLNEGKVADYVLYAGQKARGIGVQLRGWQYPCVFDQESGEARYDNFNGSWGKQDELDAYIQAYSVEQVRMTAMMQGMQVQEELLDDGSIKVKVQAYN